MNTRIYVNNFIAVTTADLSSVGTTLTISNSTNLPTLANGDYYYLTLSTGITYEIVKVTARTGLILTIVRAQEGTTNIAWSAGAAIDMRYTAASVVDSNGNSFANNHVSGYTTAATAAGTTVLTATSSKKQYFTGSTTETVTLPAVTTLSLGHEFTIVNASSGVVTVQSSGANTVQAMAANTTAVFTCILITGTTAASWSVLYNNTALSSSVAAFLATPSSANLAAALTDETGSGAAVFATSPTLVTPLLGTPTSGTLTNCTGLPISTGVSGLASNVATFLATPSSANLASAVTDETGSGSLVLATSPALVSPTANSFIDGYSTTATAAGTTTLTVSSNKTQTFTGSTTETCVLPVVSTLVLGTTYVITNLSSGVVTVQSSGANTIQAMQANTTLIVQSNATSGTSASVWNVIAYYAAASGMTGSGSVVRATSPTFVTPTLGAASATSLSFSSTSGIIGTTTNDSAAAGSVGEILSADLLVGSLITLTTATATDVVSRSFTAGDWLIWFIPLFQVVASTTSVTRYFWWTSTTSASLPAAGKDLNVFSFGATVPPSTLAFGVSTTPKRYSFASSTTVYGSVYADFTVSTLKAYGSIYGVRIR